MLDFFGGDGQYGLRFLFAFVVVLALIGVTAWLVRRYGRAPASELISAQDGRSRASL